MIDVAVVGGGAAGYFGAINAARAGAKVALLEGTRRPLTKVRISGGGRCNVTHHCFEPAELVKAYPRGAKELRGAFARFAPRDTIAWFEARGVQLKTEADGRMFPVTDDSATIADCLLRAANEAGVETRLGAIVEGIEASREGASFRLALRGQPEPLAARNVLLATGGMPAGHELARALGHVIEPPVPSLFTFNVRDPRLSGLEGVSLPRALLSLSIDGAGAPLCSRGPLLFTHWGLSGPAVLKLSAFGAIALHHAQYKAQLTIRFQEDLDEAALLAALRREKETHPRRALASHALLDFPKRFWQRLVAVQGIDERQTWADATKAQLAALAAELARGVYQVDGKGVFKEEFVTAGGVRLKEVDFRTMESRVCPGLFFAGEILDVDGVTGGFNFQNAWTTSWIAAQELGRRARSV